MYVKHIEFQQDQGELHMYIDFRMGARFRCALCGKEGLPVHDTIDKTWRHLNFFNIRYSSIIVRHGAIVRSRAHTWLKRRGDRLEAGLR